MRARRAWGWPHPERVEGRSGQANHPNGAKKPAPNRGGKRDCAPEPVRGAKRADARARRAWGWFGPAKPTNRTGHKK